MSELTQRLAALSPRKRALLVRRNPLSFAQQRLWFLDQLEPGNAFYNVPAAARLLGPLGIDAFRRSLEEIVRRHAILRTHFPTVDGRPLQAVVPPASMVLPVVDLGRLPARSRQRAVAAWQAWWAREPFDLASGPLLRVVLLRLSPREHVFLLTLHHIVIDGWSIEVIFQELSSLYDAFSAGRRASLPELRLQYLDYSRWQRVWLRGDVVAEQLCYWRRQLDGMSGVLDLPVDRPRPAAMSYRGAWLHRPLGVERAQALRALGQCFGATLFITLLSGFQALLSRLTGSQDVAVGSPIVNRGLLEFEGLIGLFLNSLVLRSDLRSDPGFNELVERVREMALEAYSHQDLPFEKLVEELQPERQLSRQPLFQVMFTMRATHASSLRLPGLTVERLPIRKRSAKFDLTMALREEVGGELNASVEYNTDLFDSTTIERLLRSYESLLSGAVREPSTRLSELPLLLPAQRHQLLAEWNDTGRRLRICDGTLHGLIEAQAEATPESIAVSFEGQHLSYGGLERTANRLAHRLRGFGLGPDQRVGVLMERSLEMVVALLGILKSGGAYVPLDPSYPPRRLRLQLADSSAAVILARRKSGVAPSDLSSGGVLVDVVEERLVEAPESRPRATSVASNLAYVIYTSGSTGRPKGVMVSHGAIVNRILWGQGHFALRGCDRVLQKTPFTFDVSVWELFWPLVAGARMVMARPGGHRDPSYLTRVLSEQGVTQVHFVPSMLGPFLQHQESVAGWTCSSVERVFCSGEAVPSELRERFFAVSEASLLNLYGPTEAAVEVSLHACDRRVLEGPVPMGRPIDNVALYNLDSGLSPVPVGVPAELHIGGLCLARGYVERPALTAETFVPDAHRSTPGGRLYRTGDRVRFLASGAIDFIGRLDHQVKVRGYRIELGEIEAHLRRHPHVEEAAVVAAERGSVERHLVAYFRSMPGVAPTAAALREFLRGRLPGHMVPAAVMRLDALPVTATGKLDRRALPSLEMERETFLQDAAYVAPRSSVEELLCGVFAAVLGLGEVGVSDHFFELGGHSLLATRVVARIREAFGIELPLRALFETPTVAGLAPVVAAAVARREDLEVPPLTPRPQGGDVALSFAQQRLWFIDQLEGGTAAYNVTRGLLFVGPLQAVILRRGLNEIVARHGVLRSSFPAVDGKPRQQVAAALALPMSVVDLSGLAAVARRRETDRLAAAEESTPLDLARGPVLRVTLLRLGESRHLGLFTLHHIVTDGWSMGVLVRELVELYGAFQAGRSSPLPPLPIQYADFAHWQREWLRGAVLERHVAYWREHLSDAPSVLDLPADRPRPAVQSYRGAGRRFPWPASLESAVGELAVEEGVTPFMVLLATFQVLLQRHSGQADLCVGTPVAGRRWLETEPLIGFFVNTLVLRNRLAVDEPFRDLLMRVRETTLGAYAHQDLPFEKLVEELAPARDLSRTPFFQTMLVLQNMPGSRLELSGFELEEVEREQRTARFDLSLFLIAGRRGLSGRLEYCTELFDPTTIVRFQRRMLNLVQSVVNDPRRRVQDLELQSASERHQMVVEWGGERLNDAPIRETARDLFETQVARSPEALAVVCHRPDGAPEGLSYRELNARANRLAYRLGDLGIEPQHRDAGHRRRMIVGLCVPRSAALVAGLLGVWKAGGAFLPLEPSYPDARLSLLLADAFNDVAAPVLVTVKALAERLTGLAPEGSRLLVLDDVELRPASADPAWQSSPEDLAYLIYTSGTTGTPKAVVVEHGSLASVLLAASAEFGFGPEDRMPCVAPFSFDIFLFELLSPLLAGGTSVLMGLEPTLDVAQLVEEITRSTQVHAVPAVMRQVVELARKRRSRGHLWNGIRRVYVGGDAVPPELISDLRETFGRARVRVLYGPTEGTIICSAHAVPTGGPFQGKPIGRPLSCATLRVCDASGRPVPIGVKGEIWVGGAGVSWGYLDREELTADRYRRLGGARYYRTGDLARWRPDGTLEFLGRADGQVKVRGHRIELAEIESLLRQHPSVSEAVVAARGEAASARDGGVGGGSGDRRLVAYVVMQEGSVFEMRELRSHLLERLPAYMVPQVFVELGSLPLTSHGKVDRQSLPAPKAAPTALAGGPPSSPVEDVLASIWTRILGVERPGSHDNFFDLGGHSLLAIQMISRVQESFGIELSVRDLFELPTIAELARLVEAALRSGAGGGEPGPSIERLPPGTFRPMSFAQQRFWLLQQQEPESPAYNLSLGVSLEGALEPSVLARALGEIVRRHEVLRTVFPATDGEPSPIVVSQLPLRWLLVDLRALRSRVRQEEGRRLLAAELRRPFDLERGPLLRCCLIRLQRQRHWMLLTQHHIVSDGWSTGVLTRELAALYREFQSAEASPLNALPVQYADFAAWQRRLVTEGVLASQLEYWRRQLRDVAVVELPLDHPRSVRLSHAGARHHFTLSAAVCDSLARLCAERGSTLFMGLLAAFKAALYSYSGQGDVAIGTPIAYRNARELEVLIGPFANTLVLRSDLSGNPSFQELVDRIREVALQAYSHQDVPIEMLVEELQPERSVGVNPLFQVWVVLQNLPPGETELPGLVLSPLRLGNGAVRHDLRLGLVESSEGLQASLEYRRDLFESPTIARVARRYVELLELAVANPRRSLEELVRRLRRAEVRRLRERKRTRREMNLEGLRRMTGKLETGRPLEG